MTLYDRVASWSNWWWPWFANHLWQSTVVALLLLGVACVLRRAPARPRYALLSLAAAKFLLPSSLFVFVAHSVGAHWDTLFDGVARPSASVSIFYQMSAPWTESGGDADAALATTASHAFLTALTVLWAAGGIALFAFWVSRRVQFWLSMRSAQCIDATREEAALARVRSWLAVKRVIRIVVLPRVIEPGVLGTWRPVIALPPGLANQLNDAELDAVIMHEVLHVARWDNLVANLQMLLCCVFWFHPLAHVVDRLMSSERERCCDQEVVRLGGAPQVYGASLLKVFQFCLGGHIAGACHATGSNLKRRIEQIMDQQVNHRLTTWHRVLIASAAAVVLAISITSGLVNRNTADAQTRRNTTSATVRGGVPGGVPGGEPGGVPRGVPGGIPGGVAGGVSGGVHGIEADTTIAGQEPESPISRLKDAPPIQIAFRDLNGAPATISAAAVKAVHLGKSPSDAENAASTSPDIYLIKPAIRVANKTDQTITGLAFEFFNTQSRGDRFLTQRSNISLAPHAAIEFGNLLGDYFAMPGEPSRLVVMIVGARFEDGGKWGSIALPPPPPPPPPAPGAGSASADAPVDGPSQAPNETPRFVRKAGGVLTGSAIRRVEPSYPALAKQAGVEGAVVVEVTVAEDGSVMAARAVVGDPLLRDAALEAARQWRFMPTTLAGTPVKVVGTITFNFQL